MKRKKSVSVPPIEINYVEFMKDKDKYMNMTSSKQRIHLMGEDGSLVASMGGNFSEWDDELPEGPWTDYMCDIADHDLMVEVGWCANSIALGYALAKGLDWEDYGSTWQIQNGQIVEAAERT